MLMANKKIKLKTIARKRKNIFKSISSYMRVIKLENIKYIGMNLKVPTSTVFNGQINRGNGIDFIRIAFLFKTVAASLSVEVIQNHGINPDRRKIKYGS